MKSTKKCISLFLGVIMVFAMAFTVSAAAPQKSSGIHTSVSESASLKLIPPSYTLQNKVKAMFGKDPGVVVTNLTSSGTSCKFDINVNDATKAAAIKAIIKSPVSIGNILVTINVNGPDGKPAVQSHLDPVTTLNNAFSGNPIFQGVEVSQNYSYYCIFAKPVIQFYNDDLSSYKGYYSAMTSDVAKEILTTTISSSSINYCISIT